MSDTDIVRRIAERGLKLAQDCEPKFIDLFQHIIDELGRFPSTLDTVVGDKLPPVGSTVFIHLNSLNAWVPHRVVGYYAWGDLNGDDSLHRVFVRVIDSDGYENSRLLKDVRPSV